MALFNASCTMGAHKKVMQPGNLQSAVHSFMVLNG